MPRVESTIFAPHAKTTTKRVKVLFTANNGSIETAQYTSDWIFGHKRGGGEAEGRKNSRLICNVQNVAKIVLCAIIFSIY